jgi:putative ABC transport system ATP-binding protein
MNGTAVIECAGITKVYPLGETKVHALRGVDLSIGAGEFVAIMGHSGSGKSTFMNILGCLDVPTEGGYRLDGTAVHSLTRHELARVRNRKLGFVFQSFNLLSRTTALENVELPLLYNATISQDEIKRRSIAALSAVGLSDRTDHYPSQLSGGQQQRVAIARSIVNDPLILLADEPTGNLDTATSIEIMAVFQRLNERGITVVLVTHETDIARYAKRAVTFRDGLIIQDQPVLNPLTAMAADGRAA